MSVYRDIRDAVRSIWDGAWTHPTVPVYWREDVPDPLPDPTEQEHFLLIEVDFGRETLMAIGGGQFLNEKAIFGSVIIRVICARSLRSEDTVLDLLSDASAVFRSKRVGSISFIGDGSGFTEGVSDDGNWYMRGVLTVFEYRFVG